MISDREVPPLEELGIRHQLLLVREELELFANDALIDDLLLVLLPFEGGGQRLPIRYVPGFLVCSLTAGCLLNLRSLLADAAHALFDAHEHELDLLGIPLVRRRVLRVVGDEQAMLLELAIIRLSCRGRRAPRPWPLGAALHLQLLRHANNCEI